MNTHLRTQRRAPGKPLARLSVAALIILTGLAPSITAHAGPDDGRIITTKGHVDAPKAYWENGTFVLKNESNPYKTGADLSDLDKILLLNALYQGQYRLNGLALQPLQLQGQQVAQPQQAQQVQSEKKEDAKAVDASIALIKRLDQVIDRLDNISTQQSALVQKDVTSSVNDRFTATAAALF